MRRLARTPAARAITALRAYAILGIRTNIPLLDQHPGTSAPSLTARSIRGFLDREGAALAAAIPTDVPDGTRRVCTKRSQHDAGIARRVGYVEGRSFPDVEELAWITSGPLGDGWFVFDDGGKQRRAAIAGDGQTVWVFLDGLTYDGHSMQERIARPIEGRRRCRDGADAGHRRGDRRRTGSVGPRATR